MFLVNGWTANPYRLNRQFSSLDAPLTLHELGRALFHVHQRRGFKSSRKNATADDKESGLIDSGIARLREQMTDSGARTAGEYLARRHDRRQPVRIRLQGAKNARWLRRVRGAVEGAG